MTPLRRCVLLLALVAAFAVPAWAEEGLPVAPEALRAALAAASQGERVQPELVELVFVARWCPPCQRAVAGLRGRARALGREGYRAGVIGVERRQTRERFVAWAEELGLRRRVVYDEGGRLERELGASMLPWFVVVDAAGRVRYSSSEPPDVETLREWLKR